MARCSEAALEEALRELSEHAASSRARSNWMSTFLVAQRMHAADYPNTVAGANSGVDDLFALLPGHRRGRSNPFVDLGSVYRWGQVEDSGRKTVWNHGTRQGAQIVLFNQDHFSNGLRPDAIDVMLQHLGTEEPLPGRDALAVLLTREHDWSVVTFACESCIAPPVRSSTWSQQDFDRITADTVLAVPVLGMPEWSPELLAASELRPTTRDDDSRSADVRQSRISRSNQSRTCPGSSGSSSATTASLPAAMTSWSTSWRQPYRHSS